MGGRNAPRSVEQGAASVLFGVTATQTGGIFRDGRTIDVPPGNRRGEKLRAGDEIYLGRACLRFER
jgi:hypothetical protein